MWCSRDTVCTDAKHKACVLNKQFQSVFTAEDLSSTPQLDSSVYPSIQDLEFSVNDIQALLEKLEPSKAPGPNLLSTKVIKLSQQILL